MEEFENIKFEKNIKSLLKYLLKEIFFFFIWKAKIKNNKLQ